MSLINGKKIAASNTNHKDTKKEFAPMLGQKEDRNTCQKNFFDTKSKWVDNFPESAKSDQI